MASEEVRIEEIQVIQDLYPRWRHQDRVVAQYRQAVDLLPPIDVTEREGRLVLIDG